MRTGNGCGRQRDDWAGGFLVFRWPVILTRINDFHACSDSCAVRNSRTFLSGNDGRRYHGKATDYASIVKKEIPSFCKTHDIMDILKHQTLILTDNIECKRLDIITENPNNAIKV